MTVISTNRLNRFWQKGVKPIKDRSEIMFREQKASYGYFGIEQNIDDLMDWVKNGKWENFAIGDYFIDVRKDGEKVQWEIADKNPYWNCGLIEGLKQNHIYCIPRDCFVTKYKYNDTPTDTGGYEASLMSSYLETEANKFSDKLQSYMKSIYRCENTKGGNTWNLRRIWLPKIVELTGNTGFTDGYGLGPVCHSLALYTGGNAHLIKGRDFNHQEDDRITYWTEDPAVYNNTATGYAFCCITREGESYYDTVVNLNGIAPGIILVKS